MIKSVLKSYFIFSKRELNGLLVFCFLLMLVVFAPLIYRSVHRPETFSFNQFKTEIRAFRASASAEPSYTYTKLKDEVEVKELEPEYFEFNPNNLDTESWKRLGLSNRQIAVIKNFEDKGGKFYKKEDLRKIYSISKEEYAKLEPYISIPERYPKKEFKSEYPAAKAAERPARPAIMIELNTADSSQLEIIRGVGPAFASRIIKYRTRLGGFHNKEQLREVYGIDSVKYDLLKDQVRADGTLIRKININTAAFEDLKPQPYLSYRQMNAIIQYRKLHGPFGSAADLKKILIINAETIAKLEPYLLFK